VVHFKNRGMIWEIWNEPNGWFWKPKVNVDDYAKLALMASKAIREAAPDEVIVGPALSETKLDFIEATARTGVLAYWSGITIHPYVRQGPESYGPAYDQTRLIIQKYAPPGRRVAVLCGESGYSAAWPKIDVETQGKYLARLFLFDVMSGVPLTIWYDWHNDGTNPKDPESNFGIVRNDYHAGAPQVYDAKPAYNAAQTYFHELGGYRFKERIKMASDDDFVLAFTKNGGECLVAWTAADVPHEVKIPARNGAYGITGYDGRNQTVVQVVDDAVALTLDGGPQYLNPR